MDGLVRVGPPPPPGVPLAFPTIDTVAVTGPHPLHEGQRRGILGPALSIPSSRSRPSMSVPAWATRAWSRDGGRRACDVLTDGKVVRFRRVEYHIRATVRKVHDEPELDRVPGACLGEGR